ncbi:hypothetical protein ABI59_20010 [Acidobacteria bacterium Mor1]|nr:hypothetical protein ABI59_20010 [Acidobacteria bacterium Mor1]
MNHYRLVATLVVACLGASGGVFAGEVAADGDAASLPDPATLVERALEAGGGRERLERTRSLELKLDFSIPELRHFGAGEMYYRAPADFYGKSVIPRYGVFEQGSDGVRAWTNDPSRSPSWLEGLELERALLETRVHFVLSLEELYEWSRTVGKKEVEGELTYEVLGVSEQGNTTSFFFSTETGLLRMLQSRFKSDIGEITLHTIFDDYRDVDGMLWPNKTRVRGEWLGRMAPEQVLTVKRIRENVEIPDKKFRVPKKLQETK